MFDDRLTVLMTGGDILKPDSRVVHLNPKEEPMGKVAIHGFGRIGRSITKVALKNNLFTPVSISDIRDIPTFAALFEVDTNYGRWHEEVKATETGFVIGGREIAYYNSMKDL